MSVIGFDLGNENSYIAVARAGGIETLANEYSLRHTPSYVAFGKTSRYAGYSAKSQQTTNVESTILNFKKLLGRMHSHDIIQQELKHIKYDTCPLPKTGQTGIKVNYLEEQVVLSVPQVLAMMLTKLKDISEVNLKTKVQDCVISVPIYFTDWERRMVLDAAQVAGLNALKLFNETTAVALAYGFYQNELEEETAKNVVFVDFGQSSLQACACALTKGKLKMLGATWNRSLGGRDFDNVLVNHFAEEFKQKYKIDVMNNKKAVIRLMAACEKLKKDLSASSLELPLNIECLMDDKDVSGRMKREIFESLSESLLEQIESTLVKLCEVTKLKPDDIHSVQIVGGSSRLPAFKSLISKVFGKEPSTTLNQDEAVARGCALQCAMLSPTFKVKEFSINDIQPYDIQITYPDQTTSEICHLDIFPYGHTVPYSKLLTYYRKEPFIIEGLYKDNQIGSTNKLSSSKIKNVVPTPEGENSKLKVKARINIHGIFSICSATMLEKKVVENVENGEVTEPVESSANVQPKSEEAMDFENTASANGEPNAETANKEATEQPESDKKEAEPKKPKIVTKAIELPIESDSVSLSKKEIEDLIEKEAQMIMQDKKEKERMDAKNAFEEYVYDLREKLSSSYEKFITNEDRAKLNTILEEAENWVVYGPGADQTKSVYVEKLKELKTYGEPVANRYRESQHREKALNLMASTLQKISKALQSFDAKEPDYNHIPEEKINEVKKIFLEKNNWYGKAFTSLLNLPKTKNPPITVEEMRQQTQALKMLTDPILSMEKPKVTPPAENVNGQSQSDSEMPDSTSDIPEKVGKAKDETETPTPWDMETN